MADKEEDKAVMDNVEKQERYNGDHYYADDLTTYYDKEHDLYSLVFGSDLALKSIIISMPKSVVDAFVEDYISIREKEEN